MGERRGDRGRAEATTMYFVSFFWFFLATCFFWFFLFSFVSNRMRENNEVVKGKRRRENSRGNN